jgi:rare lipoprotein A
MKTQLKHALGLLFVLFCLNLSAQTETGKASFYHNKFDGHGTSNGEVFRQGKFTCAHKSLPFGTWLKVTCTKNNNVVYVRVNDRLPKSSKRSIDLALVAAEKLNFVRSGITQVTMETVAENEVPEEFKSPIEMKVKPKKK